MAYDYDTTIKEKEVNGIRWRYHNRERVWLSELGDLYNPLLKRLVVGRDAKGFAFFFNGAKKVRRRVDRLVFEVFKVYEDDYLKAVYVQSNGVVEHLDGDIQNNAIQNLKYITRSEMDIKRGKVTKKTRKRAKNFVNESELRNIEGYILLKMVNGGRTSEVLKLGEGQEAEDFGEYSKLVENILMADWVDKAVLDARNECSFLLKKGDF